MKWIRLTPIALVFACLSLIAAPAQRDVSAREARQIGQKCQKDAEKQAKRAQRDAKQRQKEVACEIKRRDRERLREAKQLTKTRKKQGEEVESQAGPAEKPPPPSKKNGPGRDQPDPIERLRGYSNSESKR